MSEHLVVVVITSGATERVYSLRWVPRWLYPVATELFTWHLAFVAVFHRRRSQREALRKAWERR